MIDKVPLELMQQLHRRNVNNNMYFNINIKSMKKRRIISCSLKSM